MSRFEQGRLARVGVSHQRDYRYPGTGSRAPAQPAAYAHLLEPFANHAYPLVDEAPVRLELRLAGTAQTDSPFLALQVRPSPHQPGGQVLELGELHLKFSLEGARPLREDVEDESAPVEDPARDMAFEVALLRRTQRLIEEDDLGLACRSRSPDFVGLAGAHEEFRIGTPLRVVHGARNACSRGHGELPELVDHARRAALVHVHE